MMKILFPKIKFFVALLFFYNHLSVNSEDFHLKNTSEQQNEILIESNNQRTDLENSIFYAEGDVIITNAEKEFIAKSKKAIFYKLSGKIKLIGNVEVITRDLSKVKAGEILYFVNENKFEAVSGSNQRVNTKFILNESKFTEQFKEK
tara:strand:+ start:540 stop:980 length:441 start_codon:yes stop_codon:yes gene_type:complete